MVGGFPARSSPPGAATGSPAAAGTRWRRCAPRSSLLSPRDHLWGRGWMVLAGGGGPWGRMGCSPPSHTLAWAHHPAPRRATAQQLQPCPRPLSPLPCAVTAPLPRDLPPEGPPSPCPESGMLIRWWSVAAPQKHVSMPSPILPLPLHTAELPGEHPQSSRRPGEGSTSGCCPTPHSSSAPADPAHSRATGSIFLLAQDGSRDHQLLTVVPVVWGPSPGCAHHHRAARGGFAARQQESSPSLHGHSPPLPARPRQRARGGGERRFGTLPALSLGCRAAHPPGKPLLGGSPPPNPTLTAAEPPLPAGAGAPPHRREPEPTAGRASWRSLL